jgi:hypothetical protein
VIAIFDIFKGQAATMITSVYNSKDTLVTTTIYISCNSLKINHFSCNHGKKSVATGQERQVIATFDIF